MADLFSGLEAFGFGGLKDMGVYEQKQGEQEKEKKEEKKLEEADFLFDKTYTCPICGNDFKAKTVKNGKVKFLESDLDLRPKYQEFDPLKYDALVCNRCGYSVLARFFKRLTSTQEKLIKEQISTNFKGISEQEGAYSYDDAIARYKLVLLNTVVKKGKVSERAYVCLKLAWLYRGKKEELEQAKDPSHAQEIQQLQKEEDQFIGNAYQGFCEAFEKEEFPMCGMDEPTVTYLIAELARRCKDYDVCGRWISRVLVSKAASERLKERARQIREYMNQDKQES